MSLPDQILHNLKSGARNFKMLRGLMGVTANELEHAIIGLINERRIERRSDMYVLAGAEPFPKTYHERRLDAIHENTPNPIAPRRR